MNSEELAAAVEKFIKEAQNRVLTVGKKQYADEEGQLFERMPLEQLLEWAREELNDTAVYAVMLDIRIQRLTKILKDRGLLE